MKAGQILWDFLKDVRLPDNNRPVIIILGPWADKDARLQCCCSAHKEDQACSYCSEIKTH